MGTNRISKYFDEDPESLQSIEEQWSDIKNRLGDLRQTSDRLGSVAMNVVFLQIGFVAGMFWLSVGLWIAGKL